MSDSDTADEPTLEQQVRYQIDDGIGRITIDNPAARGGLTPDMRTRLGDLFVEASADLRVRAVLLTGTGKGFCTGAALGGNRPQSGPPRPEDAPAQTVGDGARMIRQGWQRLIGTILDCEKPVVAAVNGTTAGAGCHLALACDLVLAAEEARFIWVFVRRGIAPDGAGAYLLPRIVGPQKAKELMFFGDDLHAGDAERIGLINRAVPGEELAKVADEWARRLASGPTKAIAMTKWLVNRSLESDRGTAFHEEAWAQEFATNTEDSSEGMKSFVERREPEFKGW